MLSVKQLDDLYDGVKEYREMFEEEVDYPYIHLTTEEILKKFKDSNESKLTKEVIIVFGNNNESGIWDLEVGEDGGVWTKTLLKMSAKSKKYFADLLQKYCNIEETSDVQWNLTLK